MLDDVRDQFAGRTPPGFMPSPSTVYLTGEEFLRITTIGNLASVTLKVSGFVLGSDNRKRWFSFLHGASSNRAAASTDTKLPDGWLLGLRVVASAGAPGFGQTWCEIAIGIGQDNSKEIIQTLGCAFVTATQPFVWPNGEFMRATDGPGNIRTIVGTNPGAGGNIVETVPTGARWQLLGFRAKLVTSAAVANRVPELVVDDGTNIYAASAQAPAHVASTTLTYSWVNGIGATLVGGANEAVVPWHPGIILGPTYRIRTLTTNIDAADQWSVVVYTVLEKFDV